MERADGHVIIGLILKGVGRSPIDILLRFNSGL